MRRLSAILVAGLACLTAAPATTWAEEGGAKNVVVVTTTADGSKQARSGLKATPSGGPTVASENVALARATNCTGCRSAAVAIQAVFVTGSPSTVAPKNAAVAANGGCNDCGSYAYAYQDVFSTPGPVHLTPQGRERLNQLSQQFEAVADDGVSSITGSTSDPVLCQGCAELTAKLDKLKDEFKDILQEELVAAGHHVTGVEHRQIRVAFGSGSTDATTPTQPTDTTTSDPTTTPTTDQTSGTSGTDSSSTDSSGTDTAGSDSSGTDTSGSDTSATSGSDQTSSSDLGSGDQQPSSGSP